MIGVDVGGIKIASWVGDEREVKNAIYIILGTDIEGSIFIYGKPYDRAGLTGLIGWMLPGSNFMYKIYDERCYSEGSKQR